MSNSKHCIGFVLIILLLVTAFLGASLHLQFYNVANDQDAILETRAYSSWSNTFNSIEEMQQYADIIIEGEVVSQVAELRKDIVFTRSYIKVTKAIQGNVSVHDTICVLQTGGVFGEYVTPEISEAPLLKMENEYRMYLELTDYHEKYGQYYLILGGYQGVFDKNANILYINDIFSSELYNTVLSTRTTNSSFNPMYRWDVDILNICVSNDIYSTYGTNIYESICEGIQSWEKASQSLHTRIDSTQNTNTHVTVDMSDYGITGWDGLTTASYYTDTLICVEADVKLNTYYNYDYINDCGLWQAVTCHEFGHVLGLPHIIDYSQSSIMYPITAYYYDVDGMLKIRTPQSIDIANVNTIYNHTYTYTTLDESRHIYLCNECDYWITEDHVYTYSYFNSLYHVGECIHCGHETNQLSHMWEDYSARYWSCRDCGYLKAKETGDKFPIIHNKIPNQEGETE